MTQLKKPQEHSSEEGATPQKKAVPEKTNAEKTTAEKTNAEMTNSEKTNPKTINPENTNPENTNPENTNAEKIVHKHMNEKTTPQKTAFDQRSPTTDLTEADSEKGNHQKSPSETPAPEKTPSPNKDKPPSAGTAVHRRFPRWMLYALLGLGLIGLVARAFRPAPLPVSVGDVIEGPLQVTIDAEGKTQVEDRYVVAAPVSGRLQRIRLDAGDRVSAGSVVAEIDPVPFTTQVSAAQARIAQLQAELDGVDTQRPKAEQLAQAEARLSAAEANVRSAQADVSEAEASLAQAERDRTRADSLEAAGAIPRQDREAAQLAETQKARALEAAQQRYQSAIANATSAAADIDLIQEQQRDPDYLVRSYQAQIAAEEAQLTNLADEAARTTLSAPVSGTVLRIPESSARYVQAGEPLIEIGDATALEVVIDVLSSDAVKITPGDPIVIERWGGDRDLRGTVRYVEPGAFTEVSALGVEEQRVNIIGAFSPDSFPSPSTGLLGDGYRLEARIVIWEDPATLQVPVSALYRCETRWCVFKIADGRAEPTEVSLGPRSISAAAVESGLEEGDRVILHPSADIESGQKVSAQ